MVDGKGRTPLQGVLNGTEEFVAQAKAGQRLTMQSHMPAAEIDVRVVSGDQEYGRWEKGALVAAWLARTGTYRIVLHSEKGNIPYLDVTLR
jgi:hypothetical protein